MSELLPADAWIEHHCANYGEWIFSAWSTSKMYFHIPSGLLNTLHSLETLQIDVFITS